MDQPRVVFKSKEEREKEKEEQKLREQREAEEAESERLRMMLELRRAESLKKRGRERDGVEGIGESKEELERMRRERQEGLKKEKRNVLRPDKIAQDGFAWQEEEDTGREDLNPLYVKKANVEVHKTKGDAFEPRRKKKVFVSMDGGEGGNVASTTKGHVGGGGVVVKKDLHWSEKSREEMTSRDWRIFREDHSMQTGGSGTIPLPARSWSEMNIPEELMRSIGTLGYARPTPIQMQAIPCALQGRDIVGIAQTGSGKTVSFVVPMLMYVMNAIKTSFREELGPLALVMAPVRELVLQIADDARKLAKYVDCKVVSLVGGESIDEQGLQLRAGCHIIVATPGRLKDCLDRRYCVLHQCAYLVLDEADRMVDMGFEEDVKFIIEQMAKVGFEHQEDDDDDDDDDDDGRPKAPKTIIPQRTTILYSATMPPSVDRIARTYLTKPINIVIGSQGKPVDRIEQRVIWIAPGNGRLQRVLQDIRSTGPPCIVFCNTKKECDVLVKHLASHHVSATVLHSGKQQEQREANLASFRMGRVDVLVCTNVAGRGIDIPGVKHVINYECPANIEDYTHRIGRTGRAGSSGIATTYVSNEDSAIFYDLRKFVEESKLAFLPNELKQHPASRIKPGTLTDKHGKQVKGVE